VSAGEEIVVTGVRVNRGALRWLAMVERPCGCRLLRLDQRPQHQESEPSLARVEEVEPAAPF